MKRKVALLLGSLFLPLMPLLGAGCFGHLVYSSDTYQGKVIDAETKEPLVGAVVLAIWYREAPGLGGHGPAEGYHDALEVLTDAQGAFTVPAKTHLTAIGKIREPEFVIYYPGYGFYPRYQVRPQDDKEIAAAHEQRFFNVELPRLKTRQERLNILAGLPHDPEVPDRKMPNSIRLMNEERRRLGLQHTHILREEREQ